MSLQKKIFKMVAEADKYIKDCGVASSAKTKLTCLLDKSKVKRNITHYVAIFFWIGWTFFYLAFAFAFPFLMMYGQGVLGVIVGLMVLSGFTSVDFKKQPKVVPLSLA
jgi:hypothetical protein